VADGADANTSRSRPLTQGVNLGAMTDLVCKALDMFPDIRKHEAAAISADVLR
jgi:hypothetical protein